MAARPRHRLLSHLKRNFGHRNGYRRVALLAEQALHAGARNLFVAAGSYHNFVDWKQPRLSRVVWGWKNQGQMPGHKRLLLPEPQLPELMRPEVHGRYGIRSQPETRGP
jgi:hypothetical protein